MRTVVPTKNSVYLHNGQILELRLGYPEEVDGKQLASILADPTSIISPDQDGGHLTADAAISFDDPNCYTTAGNVNITIDAADPLFDGFGMQFKNIDGGTLVITPVSGTIDGAANYTSNTADELVALKVIDGAWQLV